MRVVIATRIFAPEVSAASAIHRRWAEEFRDRGAQVSVVTTRPPAGSVVDDPPGVDVRRARVVRDRQQYVRGYLSYLSFDIPLFFRLLFSRRPDLYVVEPPPTSVAVVRLVAGLRRVPYVVRAADYWSDAAELVTGNRMVLGALRAVEAWGLRGARLLFAAHEPLIGRLREAGITTPAIPIGLGADTNDFRYDGSLPADPPVFVYAGTHSEWHGAGIFVEAMKDVVAAHPGARLLFYGNGEEREAMQAKAAELGVAESVDFHEPIPPAELSPIFASATASLASLAPVPRNEYVVATKMYSSLAAGCPVIFVGGGPTATLVMYAEHPEIGLVVDYDPRAVAAAMSTVADDPLLPPKRADLSEWSSRTYSLDAIAHEVVDASLGVIRA